MNANFGDLMWLAGLILVLPLVAGGIAASFAWQPKPSARKRKSEPGRSPEVGSEALSD